MKMLEFFKSQTLSFYFRIVIVVLTIIPLFYMFTRITIETEYIAAIVFGFLGIAVYVILFFVEGRKWCDYFAIAGTIFLSLEFGFFAQGGMLSVVDYIYGINFWGDATQMSAIVGYGIVMFVGCALSIVVCFFKNAYETNRCIVTIGFVEED